MTRYGDYFLSTKIDHHCPTLEWYHQSALRTHQGAIIVTAMVFANTNPWVFATQSRLPAMDHAAKLQAILTRLDYESLAGVIRNCCCRKTSFLWYPPSISISISLQFSSKFLPVVVVVHLKCSLSEDPTATWPITSHTALQHCVVVA